MAALIQQGETVLVTGATGFIGNAIVEEVIAAGFNVRGTSRNASKAQFLIDHISKKYGPKRLEIVDVPDMGAPHAYDAAVKGVAGIIHVAAVLTWSANPDEVIAPCIKGTLNVFEAARGEPGVKSLVLCSSSTTALVPTANERLVVNKYTWNEKILRDVRRTHPPLDPYEIYAASKTQAERALWEAVNEKAPSFQVAAVLPTTNFGHHIRATGNSTNDWLKDAFDGKPGMLTNLPPQYFINVRDDAKLHVIALIDPACNGERILGFAEPFTLNRVLALLRKLYPGRDFGEDKDMGEDICEVANAEVEELLRKHYGHGFTGFEETIKEGLAPAASEL